MSNEPLPPIQRLLDELVSLRERLKQAIPGKGSMDILHTYQYFVESSDKGRNCTYALKCQKVFLRDMYSDVKQHIYTLMDILKELEQCQKS